MSINGIGTARCPSVGYMTRKTEKMRNPRQRNDEPYIADDGTTAE